MVTIWDECDSFKTNVALKFMKILRNLIITNQRKSGKSKYDLKLAKLDVVTMRIRYHVNGSKHVSRNLFYLCWIQQINHALFFSQSQLIKSKGYPCDEHFVQTTDNFILNIQRIPHGRNKNITRHKPKPVVFLQHGLLADSASWVFNFPKTSLAYILADNGFDVWLGNSRGNRYSRRNKYLSPDCLKFWKWS